MNFWSTKLIIKRTLPKSSETGLKDPAFTPISNTNRNITKTLTTLFELSALIGLTSVSQAWETTSSSSTVSIIK